MEYASLNFIHKIIKPVDDTNMSEGLNSSPPLPTEKRNQTVSDVGCEDTIVWPLAWR